MCCHSLYYKITQQKKSMSQHKFQTSFQYEFVASHCACTHACIHDVSGQRDAAEQIAAVRFPIFQRRDTDRRWWSCYAVLGSFITADCGLSLDTGSHY